MKLSNQLKFYVIKYFQLQMKPLIKYYQYGLKAFK